MKICGKVNDYYDNAMAFGQDNANIFVRDNTLHNKDSLEIKDLLDLLYTGKREHEFDTKRSNHVDYKFTKFLICFCGKVYRGIQVDRTPMYSVYTGVERETTKCFYDFSQLRDYLDSYGVFITKTVRSEWSRNMTPTMYEFLDKQGTLEAQSLLIEKKIPIFTIQMNSSFRNNHTHEMRTNGELKKLEFYRVFDSFQAYQEIDMFISGIMSQNENKVMVVGEKDRIQQHGFDKWSFRKQPTKKR